MPRHSGPSMEVAVPHQLQPFFTVNHFNVPLHGRGRHKQKKLKPGLHGRGRSKQPDPWKGRGKISGR